MMVGSGGCKPRSAEEYNQELADAICQVRRNCPEVTLTSMTGSVEFPSDGTCEAAVLTQFDMCGSSCKYRPSKGAKCLRRLEKLAENCEGSVGPCRKAYKKCDSDEETSRCNLHNCGSRVDAPSREGLPWLALVLVGWFARRRRAA